MHPPFQSTGAAIGFVAVLGSILVLPVVLKGVGYCSRAQTYASVGASQGQVGRVVATISKGADADVVIVGTSALGAAVNLPVLQQELSDQLHRPVKVRLLSFFHNGLDSEYFSLRSMFDEAHGAAPKLILLANPHAQEHTELPHKNMYLWLRYGEYPEIVSKLPLSSKVTVYGEEVFGAPRQFLSLLRPNLLTDQENDALRFNRTKEDQQAHGFQGKPFQATIPPTDRPMPLDKLSSSRCSPTAKLGKYSLVFLQAMNDLAKSHHATVGVLNINLDDDFGQNEINVSQSLIDTFGPQTPFIGAGSDEMWPGLTQDQERLFFSDNVHMNANGNAYFTKAIAPAIATLLGGLAQR